MQRQPVQFLTVANVGIGEVDAEGDLGAPGHRVTGDAPAPQTEAMSARSIMVMRDHVRARRHLCA